MIVSIIIRTYNEELYLEKLILAILNQEIEYNVEIVIVDSGSTDKTLEISKKYNCRITHIEKEKFTFGRSLNYGCEFAKGDILVFISGHCIPVNNYWLKNLVKPIQINNNSYSYGRQIGHLTTKYSEHNIFRKYFPEYSKNPQRGFFCNNANAAIHKSIWKKFKFNEDLTGLEDMYLAKELIEDEGRVDYISSASVYHIHNETWKQVQIRYEREAIALQKISPEIILTVLDAIVYCVHAIIGDLITAFKQKQLFKNIISIIFFRFNQYSGSYKGSKNQRKISKKMKHIYFYPKDIYKK